MKIRQNISCLRNYVYPILFCVFCIYACTDNGQKQQQNTSTEKYKVEEKSDEQLKTILFFGNSLTAGLGLGQDEAFPALIQQKLDSAGLKYQAINAGISGETTADGLARIDWALKQQVDIFVLELGANDGLRGLDPTMSKKNLQSIIDKVKTADSKTKIILTGMQIPPSMGKDYTEEFKQIFPELAKENDIYFVPFLLEGVAGKSNLNQDDGIHPTVEGQKILAKNVWEVLEEVIK